MTPEDKWARYERRELRRFYRECQKKGMTDAEVRLMFKARRIYLAAHKKALVDWLYNGTGERQNYGLATIV